jgi:[pyruvate, water dikinase]-phosphate phosphotransferase / [pyruvate, water dikinase] kinase
MPRIYVVSDATGATAERALGAALSQFEDTGVEIVRYQKVRTPEKIREIVDETARRGGFIVHTLVSAELRSLILNRGRAVNVTTIDLMGPLLARLSEMLKASPRTEPGIFSPFDSGYLERVEAMDFTVRHDDGRNVHELDQADLILVGVSRTSKTPLSIYLGYRGWRVANVPLVYGVPPPKQLFKVPASRVVALTATPQRLSSIRQVRVQHMKTASHGYADLTHVEREIAYAYEIFSKRKGWPIVDVTVKTIEETATEVISLIRLPKRMEERKMSLPE